MFINLYVFGINRSSLQEALGSLGTAGGAEGREQIGSPKQIVLYIYVAWGETGYVRKNLIEIWKNIIQKRD